MPWGKALIYEGMWEWALSFRRDGAAKTSYTRQKIHGASTEDEEPGDSDRCRFAFLGKIRSPLDNPEAFADPAQNLKRFGQICAFVCRRNNGAQACFAFCHHREADRLSEHPGRKKLLREFPSLRSVTDQNRDNRRFAHSGFEAQLLQAAAEELRIRPQFLDELFTLDRIEQRKGGLAGSCDRGWVRRGKQERAPAMIEKIQSNRESRTRIRQSSRPPC
jgi:hypothetical protein